MLAGWVVGWQDKILRWGAGRRKLSLVYGMVTNNTFGDGFEEGRWIAQVGIGIRNGTNNTFGWDFEDGRW